MIIQLIANALIAGAAAALLGVGFVVVYSGSRFFIFTFGVSFAWAAYTVLALAKFLTLWGAVPVGIAVGAVTGVLLEQVVYRRIRRGGQSPLVLMLASIGAYTILQNLISVTFGDETRALDRWPTNAGYLILGARVTAVQIIIVAASIVTLFGTWLVLSCTRLGRYLRAAANDEHLARIIGINVELARCYSTLLGCGIAAIAGVLTSIDTGLVPTMGFQGLLTGVVAAIVGGIDSARGAVMGGLLVGIAQHLGVWRLPTEWQDAIVFLAMFVMLLVRPQGVLGSPVHRSAV